MVIEVGGEPLRSGRTGDGQAEPANQPPAGAAVQDHYSDSFAHCHGCGRLNPEGLHLRSMPAGDEVVARMFPGEHDISFPGFAYGGYMASILDCHCIATATAAAHRARGLTLGKDPVDPFVTASLKVDFVRPTPAAGPLDLRAHAVLVEGRKVVVQATLSVKDVVCVRAEVVAVQMPQAMRPHGTLAP